MQMNDDNEIFFQFFKMQSQPHEVCDFCIWFHSDNLGVLGSFPPSSSINILVGLFLAIIRIFYCGKIKSMKHLHWYFTYYFKSSQFKPSNHWGIGSADGVRNERSRVVNESTWENEWAQRDMAELECTQGPTVSHIWFQMSSRKILY